MVSKITIKQHNNLKIIALAFVWTLGNAWTFQWFFNSLKSISFFNLIVLGIVFTVLLVKITWNNVFKNESLSPKFYLYPLVLMLGGEISAILLKWSINIPQLTLLCFLLASYGLLGLFIDRHTWYKGLSIAAIGACIIPFSVAFTLE